MDTPPVEGQLAAVRPEGDAIAAVRPIASGAPSRLVTLALIALLSGIWGSTWLVIQGGLDHLPPLTGAAPRFLLAGAVFALIAPRLSRREGGERPSFGLVAIIGTLNITISYAIVYASQTVLPSGLVSLIWAVNPMILALMTSVWLPEEHLGRRQWIGLGAGLCGMVVLFAKDVAAIGPGALPAGLLLLVSPAVSAAGSLVAKRRGRGVSSLYLNRGAMLFGGVMLTVLALLFEDVGDARWTPAAIGSVVYLSLIGTVLAFGLYFWLLRHAPAHELAVIAYVTPVIALFLGATLADEPVSLHTILGAALILSGVGLVLRARRPKVATVAES